MKVLMINSVCGIRSTGRICTDLADVLKSRGHECKIAYGRESVPEKYKKDSIKIATDLSVKIDALKSRFFDNAGFNSKQNTKKFIEWIKEYNPDVIHLHNLHGYYINVEILFEYLKTCGKKIVWTLHDCWAFTGHCAHFDFNECVQWKTGCKKCAYKYEYPKSLFSQAEYNYKRKQQLFTGLPNLQLIVPSNWMKSMVTQSYMKAYPIKVLSNGIDLNYFRRDESDFKAKKGLTDRFVILGVASFWNKMKGLDVFIRLSGDLNREKFQVILVGNIDKGALSNNILHIPEINNIQELCKIYTAADVFVNPTLQETQGLTTVEAFACGTPAIVFNSGGAAECIKEQCGIVVEKNDYEMLREVIIQMQKGEVDFDSQNCIKAAHQYDAKQLYQEYVKLYESLI